MKTKRFHYYLLSLLLGALILPGCGQRGDETGIADDSSASNDFLLFPNSHASVGVGDYTIWVVGPTVGVTTTLPYTLTVRFTDGTTSTYTGTWTGNFEIDTIPLEITRAGGVTLSLNSGGELALLALQTGSSTQFLAISGDSTWQANPSIDLPKYQIDQALYAQKYYEILDPTNAKTTLSDWKTANGFSSQNCNPGTVGTVTEHEVRFHDQHDLGYGRHMCARRDSATGDIAVWVENFKVTAVPGQDYGQLNLEAVVNGDYRWHIGTNAIEYSATTTSAGVKFVKFYTFNPDGTRRTLVDLDGKGAKALPIPCITCHGGTAWPLQTVWNGGTGTTDLYFPKIVGFPRADVRAQMQPIDVGSLAFSPVAGYRRQDQESALKGINQFVLCTYPIGFASVSSGAEDTCRAAATKAAQWQGTTAEMIKRWYDNDGNGFDMESATFNDSYVPTGWTDAATAPTSSEVVPAGATNVYRQVVAPNCRVCHALRGNANGYGSDDIDFMEYQKFIGGTSYAGYASRIKYHVFERGNMPLALLKYDQFWDSNAPSILAALIPGALGSGGQVLKPTRPVANPGPDRTIVTNAATKLSAAGSSHATRYRWRITSQPGGSTASLDETPSDGDPTMSTSIRPTFLADMNGTYTIELTVGDGSSNSDPVTLTLATVASLQDDPAAPVVSGITNPAAITFRNHIRPILQDNTIYGCTGCHFGSALVADGPPVHYNDWDRVGTGVVAGTDNPNRHQLYLDVRARVNLKDVVSSRILMRPSGNHHPGMLLPNFDSTIAPGSNGRGAYDIFLHWILNGAPE